MKVNDLKALYEKAGTIKTQTNPTYHKPVPVVPRPDVPPPVQPIQVPPATETISAPPEVAKQQTRKSMVKNKDFLNELNKKLMLKTIKPDIQEQKPQEEFKKQVQIIKEVERTVVTVNEPKVQPIPIQPQSQLSFEDIMGDLGQQKDYKESLKARYGINERHPTTREEELIFTELEEQRKSTIQAQKENSAKEAVSYLRRPKPKPESFHSSVAYSKFKTDDKIKRIDRIINFIFGDKQSELVKSERPQNPKRFSKKRQSNVEPISSVDIPSDSR